MIPNIAPRTSLSREELEREREALGYPPYDRPVREAEKVCAEGCGAAVSVRGVRCPICADRIQSKRNRERARRRRAEVPS